MMKVFKSTLALLGFVLFMYGTAVATISSPDGYGYVYQDGISNNMSSISGSGSQVAWVDLGVSAHSYSTTKIPLGFSFVYYGTEYDSIYVMTGGWLSFVSQVAHIPSENSFPEVDTCDGVIAPLAITFDISFDGPDVYYETQGTAPNRMFVVEWSGALDNEGNGFDFQAVLHEEGNRIEFIYDNLADDYFGFVVDNAHVGIESPDETDGLEYSLTTTFGSAGEPIQEESILFGTPFALTYPFADTSIAGEYILQWAEEISSNGSAGISLFYDNGTDTTGTLITGALTKSGNNSYDWDAAAIPLDTPYYLYGVFIDGTDTTISYAPGTITFVVGYTAGLSVTPAAVSPTADDSVTFTATASDTFGHTWDVSDDAGTVWSGSGSKAPITNGGYNADTVGSFIVYVTYDGFSDTAAVTVSNGAVVMLTVTGELDTIAVNDTARHTVEAADSDGNTWDVTIAAAWMSVGDVAGSVVNGNFVTTVPGEYKIIATYAGRTDTANLYADPTVPVELSSFTATISDAGITLAWTTETETNNLGFNVLRAVNAAGPFNKVNNTIISGAGTAAEPHEYFYMDKDATCLIYYVLEQVDIGGTRTLSTVLAVDAGVSGIHNNALNIWHIEKDVQLYDMTGKPVMFSGTGVYLAEDNGILVKRIIIK